MVLGTNQRYQMNSCIRLEAETPRGQAFESAEVQKSVREFLHGLNFSKRSKPLHATGPKNYSNYAKNFKLDRKTKLGQVDFACVQNSTIKIFLFFLLA